MARTYKRDSRGRFAGGGGGSSGGGGGKKSGGGSGSGKPKGKGSRKKAAQQEANRKKNAELGLKPQDLRAAQRAASKHEKQSAAYASGKRSRKLDVSSATTRRALDYLYAKANKGRLPNGNMASTKKPKGFTTGFNAKAAQSARTKQFSSKAAPNTAKAKYKAARSQVRELKMYRGGKTDATVKKAQARVARMEKSRKSSRARI